MAAGFASGPGAGAGAGTGARDWARAGAGSWSGAGVLVLMGATWLLRVLAGNLTGRAGPGMRLPAFHLDPGVRGGGPRARAAARPSAAVSSAVISPVPWPWQKTAPSHYRTLYLNTNPYKTLLKPATATRGFGRCESFCFMWIWGLFQPRNQESHVVEQDFLQQNVQEKYFSLPEETCIWYKRHRWH